MNTPQLDTDVSIQASLTTACESLLPELTTGSGNPEAEQLQIAAIIGFTGDNLRGTLALATDHAGLQAICENLGASTDQAADSLGEMTNLIAGHVKRRLANLGELVEITPPTVVRGVTIEVCGGSDLQRAEHRTGTDGNSTVAWLDYDATDELTLVENASSDSMDDGEMLLF